MSERNFQVALPVCSGWPNITVPLCPAGLGRSLSVFRAQTCGSRQLRVSATVVACLRIDDNGNAAKCSSCRDRRTVVWLLHKKRSNMSILLVVYHKLQLVYMLLIFTKGRLVQPKQMNFRKSSKWSLTTPPPPWHHPSQSTITLSVLRFGECKYGGTQELRKLFVVYVFFYFRY